LAKILITGGAGFIGFNLAKHLSKFDNEITILDNFSRGKSDKEFNDLLLKKNIHFKKIDLLKNDLHKLDDDFDHAYHLAAVNGTRYFYEIPEQLLKINILSTINFLDWVVSTKCKNIMFSSSSETYAGTISHYKEKIPTPEEIPLCIEDIFNPRFSYAGSKIAGELLVINYAKKFELNAKIVRFHNIYGPRMGNEHVIPEFCLKIIRKENPFRIQGGSQTRAFCFVDDAIKAIKSIMEDLPDSIEIFHVGNDLEEISISGLAKKLFDITDFHPEFEILEELPGSVSRRCPSINKLKQTINYEPKVALDKGLKSTFEWYQNNFKNN